MKGMITRIFVDAVRFLSSPPAGREIVRCGADFREAPARAFSVKGNSEDTFDVCVERFCEAAVAEFRIVPVGKADESGGGAFLVAVESPAVGDVRAGTFLQSIGSPGIEVTPPVGPAILNRVASSEHQAPGNGRSRCISRKAPREICIRMSPECLSTLLRRSSGGRASPTWTAKSLLLCLSTEHGAAPGCRLCMRRLWLPASFASA